MTADEYRVYLRKLIDTKFEGSQSVAANTWKVSKGLVSGVLDGSRNPGRKIVKATGFKAIVSYSKVA